MKKTIIAIAILLAVNTGTFAQMPKHGTHKHSARATKYTCTMHSEVVMDKPGKCPKCGMTLVKKKSGKMKGMKM